MQVTDILGDAGAPETITPGDTATGITDTIYRQTIHGAEKLAIGALLTCEDETVNMTFDGTAPTAAAGTNVGHAFSAGESYVLRGTNNVKNWKCIDRVSLSAGSVKVTPFFG
jgi:hypothetical protein